MIFFSELLIKAMISNTQTDIQPAAKKRRLEGTNAFSQTTGRGIFMAPEHIMGYDGEIKYSTVTCQPAVNRFSLTNTAPFVFVLEQQAASVVKDLSLEFELEIQNYAEPILPVHYWFERIEIWRRKGQEELQRMHADTMFNDLLTHHKDDLRVLEKVVNFDAESGLPSSYIQPLGPTNVQRYILPLLFSFMDGMDIDFSRLKTDLEIKFYPRGDIRLGDGTDVKGYAGSKNNFLLNSMRWISLSEALTPASLNIHDAAKMSMTVQKNYMDRQVYVESGRVLNAGLTYQFDLDQFSHDSGLLLFAFRPTGPGTTFYNIFNCQTLGPNGTLDMKNVSGLSMLGSGTPLTAQYWEPFVQSRFWPHNMTLHRGWYIMPFTRDVRSMLEGGIDGSHKFEGIREKVEFKTSYQVVLVNNPPGGGITIGEQTVLYRGSQILNPAGTGGVDISQGSGVSFLQLTRCVNMNPKVIEDNLLFNIVGANGPNGQVGAVFLWDVNVRDRTTGQPTDLKRIDDSFLTLPSNSTVGGVNLCSISNITRGRPGWRNGTYDITVYSYYHRHLHEAHGTFHVDAQ
jgi:hypothetical protein